MDYMTSSNVNYFVHYKAKVMFLELVLIIDIRT